MHMVAVKLLETMYCKGYTKNIYIYIKNYFNILVPLTEPSKFIMFPHGGALHSLYVATLIKLIYYTYSL